MLADYDALPAIGHGCGHNLIAVSGLAAKVSTAMALTALDLLTDVELLRQAKDEHARWSELYEGW